MAFVVDTPPPSHDDSLCDDRSRDVVASPIKTERVEREMTGNEERCKLLVAREVRNAVIDVLVSPLRDGWFATFSGDFDVPLASAVEDMIDDDSARQAVMVEMASRFIVRMLAACMSHALVHAATGCIAHALQR
tara:strand:+ start:137 stop:538 length:402 start_codon:yes stop_codon:yes gene_type:complete